MSKRNPTTGQNEAYTIIRDAIDEACKDLLRPDYLAVLMRIQNSIEGRIEQAEEEERDE
jgi:hypothetical protein